MATKRPCLRKSTRAQSKAKETNGEGPRKVDNDKLSEPIPKTQTRRITKLKKHVTEKPEIINIDEDSEHGDGSFISQIIPSGEKDTFLCSQDTSAEVFWDCTSPDMRKIIRSRHRRDKHLKSNVVDIVQTLSTTSDVDTEELEDKSKNGLLGLWMDSDAPDISSKFTATNLTSFSPTNSFPPQRAQKEKREATDTLSSVLQEKLSMRIKKERSPLGTKIRSSAEKRKRSSLSGVTESPSKISKVERNEGKACDLPEEVEKLSETSWSEDDFYEEDSFIIRATQAPGELANKCETKTSSNKEVNNKVCAHNPGKYSDQKNTGSLPNKSSYKKGTNKNDFATTPQRPSGSMKKPTHTITKTVSAPTADVKKKSKRNSLGLNSSLSDDILCQIVETDCILDSQIENVKQGDSEDLKNSHKKSLSDIAKKTEITENLRTSVNTKSKCSDQVNECKNKSARRCVNKEYTFVPKSKTVQPSTTLKTFQGVQPISCTTSRSENLSITEELKNVQKSSVKPTSTTLPDESADLFQSDEEDLLSEPQVLALLDAVESQVPMANCSFSSSQPNMTPDKSSQTETKSPCKRRNISETSQAHTPRKCTAQEIELKKSVALAKRLSSSQPTSSQTLCSPEKSHNQSISPQKCTPEEIEQKRQAAIAKKLSCSQEFNNSQTKHDDPSSLCLSPNKERVKDVSSSKYSPRKCSPEEIQRKKELAQAKRQKKGPGTVNVPVLSTFEQSERVGQGIIYPETPVCGGQKVNAGDGNTQSDTNKSNSLQDVIEKKRLEALKRRELKLKASQAYKS